MFNHSGSSDVEARARAMFEKKPGTLTLTNTKVTWVEDGQTKPKLIIPHAKLTSMFCSKEGSPKTKMKISTADSPDGHMFNLTSPQPVAQAEMATFRRLILEIITRNTTTSSIPVPGSVPRRALSTAPRQSTPATTPRPSTPALSRASSSTPSRGGQPPGYQFRAKVLTSMPELSDLHRELVIGGQITEAEFWEGREHLLAAELSTSNQRKGKPSEIVDPRPTTTDAGEIKLTLTPQMLSDIFEEFPVVERAYSENVPKPLSEGEFWKRYFESKLFNRHRASSRNAVAKDDKIFDQYLEKEDDEIEPLHQRDERLQLLLDLGATEQDHGETGNEKDVTMQAGKRKGALPLIRRFNEHSEKLLESALGDHRSKRARLDKPEGLLPEKADYNSQIDLEDLHERGSSPGIALQMQDRQRYFSGLGDGNATGANKPTVADLGAVTQDMEATLEHWARNLNSFRINRKAGDDALASMTENVTSRLDVRLQRNGIPPHILQQVTTCAAAANEFLRQFWTATYPPPQDAQTPSSTTPAQRAARAAKMINYLSKTHEKAFALVRAAHQEGADANLVEVAFKPLLAAVDRAIETYKRRK